MAPRTWPRLRRGDAQTPWLRSGPPLTVQPLARTRRRLVAAGENGGGQRERSRHGEERRGVRIIIKTTGAPLFSQILEDNDTSSAPPTAI